jgi:hypothetical protein
MDAIDTKATLKPNLKIFFIEFVLFGRRTS